MRCVIHLLVVIYCTLAGLQTGLTQTEKRVALVIGNSTYQHTRALPNPKNDAEAIAKLLRESGFAEVRLETDLGYGAMRDVMRAFGETARAADIALVYYAGHGVLEKYAGLAGPARDGMVTRGVGEGVNRRVVHQAAISARSVHFKRRTGLSRCCEYVLTLSRT